MYLLRPTISTIGVLSFLHSGHTVLNLNPTRWRGVSFNSLFEEFETCNIIMHIIIYHIVNKWPWAIFIPGHDFACIPIFVLPSEFPNVISWYEYALSKCWAYSIIVTVSPFHDILQLDWLINFLVGIVQHMDHLNEALAPPHLYLVAWHLCWPYGRDFRLAFHTMAASNELLWKLLNLCSHLSSYLYW